MANIASVLQRFPFSSSRPLNRSRVADRVPRG